MAEYRYRTPPRRGEDIGDMDISYGIEHPHGSKENTPVRNKKAHHMYVPSLEEWTKTASMHGRSERVKIPKKNPFTKKYGGKTRKGHKRSHYRKKKNPTKKNMKNKTCKNFCRKVYLPERERVEKKFSKYYEPIEVMRNKDDEFEKKTADILEDMYLKSCDEIYCQKKCKIKNKKKWVESISKERKEKLEKQGAISGCRDLIKEYPDYYKNI